MKPTCSRVMSRRNAKKLEENEFPGNSISVNQGLQKIKLDEDEQSIKVVNVNSAVCCENPENVEQNDFTEEYTVTRVEFETSAENLVESPSDQQNNDDVYSYREEIETLKSTVKQLSLQVHNQSKLITGIKSGLRNAVVSLMTFCSDEKCDEEVQRDFEDPEPPVIIGTSTQASKLTAEDPLSSKNMDKFCGSRSRQNVAYQDVGKNTSRISDDQNEMVDVIGNHGIVENENSPNGNGETCSDNLCEPESEPEKDNSDDDPDYLETPVKKSTLPTKHDKRGNTVNISGKSKGGVNCPTCGKTLKNRRTLSEHIARVHQKKPLNCHLCGKIFVHRGSRYRHIKNFHEGFRHECTQCPGEFITKEKLLQHEKRVHLQNRRPIIKCNICGVHLASKLNEHMRHKHNDLWTSSRFECSEENMEKGNSNK